MSLTFKRDLYLAVVYYPPGDSVVHNRDDILGKLTNDVANYSRQGDILIGGDFNAYTGTLADFCLFDDIEKIYYAVSMNLPADFPYLVMSS